MVRIKAILVLVGIRVRELSNGHYAEVNPPSGIFNPDETQFLNTTAAIIQRNRSSRSRPCFVIPSSGQLNQREFSSAAKGDCGEAAE